MKTVEFMRLFEVVQIQEKLEQTRNRKNRRKHAGRPAVSKFNFIPLCLLLSASATIPKLVLYHSIAVVCFKFESSFHLASKIPSHELGQSEHDWYVLYFYAQIAPSPQFIVTWYFSAL